MTVTRACIATLVCALLHGSVAAQRPTTLDGVIEVLSAKVRPMLPKAIEPTPAQTNVSLKALLWRAPNGDTCDVYLGTATSPPLVKPGVPCQGYPVTLKPATKYYWKVKACNPAGCVTGPTWTFTTAAEPPPPPPPIGAPFTTFGFTAGWATFGLSIPPGLVKDAVRVGAFETQTDIKTRWPDGSARFAIVTARTDAGSHPLQAVAPLVGALTPTWPKAAVAFTIGTETYRAELPSFTPSDCWLSGPVVRECRVIVSPIAAKPHPVLQVVFDVRSYKDGGHRVDVVAQTIRDVAEADRLTYNVVVTLNDKPVFARTAVDHAAQTRWRQTFVTETLAAVVTPNVEQTLVATGAVLRFLPTVENGYGAPSGEKYDILKYGDLMPAMPSPGGRPDIGFLPYFTAQYLVHRTAGGLAYLLKHGDLSGSWSGHLLDPDGSLPTLDEYPRYWIDWRAAPHPDGPRSREGGTNPIENAHMPSLTYVPYLLTGDRYYLDQVKLWANAALLLTWPFDPTKARVAHLTDPNTKTTYLIWQNQVRGLAWTMRLLGECVTSLPDSDPDKPYFTRALQANADQLEAYGTSDHGPIGAPFAGKWGTDPPGYGPNSKMHVAYWMHSYLAIELDWLERAGLPSAPSLRNRIAKNWVDMWSDPGYDRKQFAPYFLFIAQFDSAGKFVAYESLKRAYAETFHPDEGTRTPLEGYYGPEAWAGLVLAVKLKVPNAEDALAWLAAQPGVMADVNRRSGFAIARE